MQQQQKKPTDEINRMISVRSLHSGQGNTTPELAALAALARGVFGAAFAAINIVEEDWLRIAGQAGLVFSDCARDQSVCTRVVYANDIVVVPDLQLDAELSVLPFVTGEPHLRFYAGAPLALEDGMPVGAFCFFDTHPRQLSPTERETLQDFAMVASSLLRLQKSNIVMALAEQDLRAAAMTDPLTGFFNRAALPAFVDRSLADALQAGREFGALYIDMDGFKTINDRFGHHAGDDVLRQGAERIRAVIRSTDIVVRMGGDEFAIFAPDSANREALRGLAQRLVEAFREPFVLDGRFVNARISVGAALAPDAGRDRSTLLKKVDDALYLAKSAGRDQFVLDLNLDQK